ncbi:MAG: hypothetical protein F083_2904 [bacterium F083]|nr:MAG: hypothetical protein F083_2904 [bacterium F083]
MLQVADEGGLAVEVGHGAATGATAGVARSAGEVEHRATHRVGGDVVVVHAVVGIVEAEDVLNTVFVLVVGKVGSARWGGTGELDSTLAVDERQVAAPVADDPEAIALRIVGNTTLGAIGTGEGAHQAVVSQVDTVNRGAVGNTIEVLAIIGHATERSTTGDIEAFDHVALEVILIEIMCGSAITPVGGIEVVAVKAHTIMAAFGSVEGHHQIPRSADALFTRNRVRIVVGSGVAGDGDRLGPVDGSLNHLTAVALVDGTDTPLVDTRLEVGPLNVDVDGVGHPDGGQQDGVVFGVGALLVAVRAVHSVVVQAAGRIFHSQRSARSVRIDALSGHSVVTLHVGAEVALDWAVGSNGNRGVLVGIVVEATASTVVEVVAHCPHATTIVLPTLAAVPPVTVRVAVGIAHASRIAHATSLVDVPHNPEVGAAMDRDRSRQIPVNPFAETHRQCDSLRGDQRTGTRSAAAFIDVAGVVATHGTAVEVVAEHGDLCKSEAIVLRSQACRIMVSERRLIREVGTQSVIELALKEGVPTGTQRFGSLVEADIVHVEAVVVRVDATILRVSPLEGVRTSSDVELALTPAASSSVLAHLLAVDEEVAIVPVLLAADLAEEAHFAVGRDVHRHGHVARHVGHACATALHAVGAFIRVVGGDAPRIGGIDLPVEGAEVAGLERLNDLFAGQAAAPVHLHIR